MSKPSKPSKPPKYASFPEISSIFPDPGIARAVELLEEDLIYQEQENEVQIARARIKEELASISERSPSVRSAGGFRHGRWVCYYKGMTTRKGPPNAGLLAQHLVPLDVIEDCRKDSKPYLDLKVVDLDKPKSKDDWETE